MFINLSHCDLPVANGSSEQKEPQVDLNEMAYNPGKLYKIKGVELHICTKTEAFSSGCNMIFSMPTRACLASLKHSNKLL